MTVLLLRTEWNGTEQNGTERNEYGTIEKKEQERNDLAEGPWNDLKKVVNCPALAEMANFKFILLYRDLMQQNRTARKQEDSKMIICILH